MFTLHDLSKSVLRYIVKIDSRINVVVSRDRPLCFHPSSPDGSDKRFSADWC